jgi:hypothetical protein
MTEARTYPRFGGALNTREWFIQFVDFRLEDGVAGDGAIEHRSSFTAASEFLLPASELIVRRFAAFQDRNLQLPGADGSTVLGITHSPGSLPPESSSSEQEKIIENEFSVNLNGNPLSAYTSKTRFVRGVLWDLTQDANRGGITDYIDRSRGVRVSLQGLPVDQQR